MSEAARTVVRAEIVSVEPLDELEARTQQDAIRWLDSGAEVFRVEKPDVPNKHLVSYFLLVDGDWVLLVDHINAELWLPTGGHVDIDEDPRQTVVREAMEELGVAAQFLVEKPLFVTCTKTVGKTSGHWDVSFWYALKGDRTVSLQFDQEEFYSVKWFHRDDLPFEKSDPELQRFMQKLDKIQMVS